MTKQERMKIRFQKRMCKHNLLTLFVKHCKIDDIGISVRIPFYEDDYAKLNKYLDMYNKFKKGNEECKIK